MKKKYKLFNPYNRFSFCDCCWLLGSWRISISKGKKLILEIQRIADLSVKKQEKNQDLKCKGAYAEVEKSVKKYTIDYTKKGIESIRYK